MKYLGNLFDQSSVPEFGKALLLHQCRQVASEGASPVWIESGGSRPASCSATLPIPLAGRQFLPVARHLITNSKSRDVTLRSLSKNMPPRNGLKNLSIMASENPSACNTCSVTSSFLTLSQTIDILSLALQLEKEYSEHILTTCKRRSGKSSETTHADISASHTEDGLSQYCAGLMSGQGGVIFTKVLPLRIHEWNGKCMICE